MEESLLGKLIEIDGSKWRVIYTSNCNTRGCLVETKGKVSSKLKFHDWMTPDLLRLLRDKANPARILDERSHYIVDKSTMDEEHRLAYEKKVEYVHELAALYGPDYDGLAGKKPKPEFEKIWNRYGFVKATAWKYIRLYLQSGFRDSSLIDQRAFISNGKRVGEMKNMTGPKGDEYSRKGIVLTAADIANMELAIRDYLQHRESTKESTYYAMLDNFYLGADGRWMEQRPSMRQFMLHFDRKVSERELLASSMNPYEFTNNHRAPIDSPRTMKLRPGQILEADECELDVICVDSHRRNCIGRPVMYGLVDLYSHVIVAISVGFKNNSMAGLRSVFVNLFEDKVKYCERFGIQLKDRDFWPSCFLPEEIRGDQGAEYGSDKLEELCFDLDIRRDLEMPAGGSFKGAVERMFGEIHSPIRPIIEDKGLIRKAKDSNHYKTASLTVYEITQAIINGVIHHNNMCVDKMKTSMEMVANDVGTVPTNIWKYGIEQYGLPTQITDANREEKIFKLLESNTATICKDGVHCKGIRYLPSSDSNIMDMIHSASETPTKERTMTVRLDPRDTTHLFYLKDGLVSHLDIINTFGNEYQDICWQECDYLQGKKRTLARKEKKERELLRGDQRRFNVAIVNNVPKMDTVPNCKNIRENRQMEELRLEQENPTFGILLGNDVKSPEVVEEITNKGSNENKPLENPKPNVQEKPEAEKAPESEKRRLWSSAMSNYGRIKP